MVEPAPRHILFVVGMHRSGTSALCAALDACGATFGSELMGAMDGVNQRGFWESKGVVSINEELLHGCGVNWYSVSARDLDRDWSAAQFDEVRNRARDLLRAGFGPGPLEAVKDPRLCITLPFWLPLCAELGIAVSVCVMLRDPNEVAESLLQRDGFPRGYGLRLLEIYLGGVIAHAPPGYQCAVYEALLEDAAAAMAPLCEHLPLNVDADRLHRALDRDLRHQVAGSAERLPLLDDDGALSLDSLRGELERAHPAERVLAEFAEQLAERGREISRIGDAHTHALDTLGTRDRELSGLAAEHTEALGTIVARDGSLRELDQRLQELGDMHSHALRTVNERDQQLADVQAHLEELGGMHDHALSVIEEKDTIINTQNQDAFKLKAELAELNRLHDLANRVIDERQEQLQNIFRIPLLGLLFRVMWNRESR